MPQGHIVPEAQSSLASIDRRLRWLVVAMFAVAAALMFVVAAVFGTNVEFHAGEGLLIGGACGAGVAMGFVFGWLAHAAMRRVP
jgi:hypothetical protein